jgi:hypothetical protein
VNARGAEAVLRPGVSRFFKRGTSTRQPCTKGRKCCPLDSRGHRGLDGQRGRTRIEAALNCRMMDMTDGTKLKGGKHQLKCSD